MTVPHVTKSLQDNKGFAVRASLSGLKVLIVDGRVTIQITPTLAGETDALSVNSQTELVAAKAIFGYYPDATAVRVEVWGDATDQNGRTLSLAFTWIEITPATASRFDYQGLLGRVYDDNKILFCDADHYSIQDFVWAKISNIGCPTRPSR